MSRDGRGGPRVGRDSRGGPLRAGLGLLSACGFFVALAAGEPEKSLRLPPDIVLDAASGSPGAVVFRHTTHAALTDNKCLTCHPRPFAILRPTRKFLHDDMNAGRSCGICHDGKSAFGATDPSSCQECHSGRETAAPEDGAGARRPATEGSHR